MEWQKLDTKSGAPLWFLQVPHVRNVSFGVLTNVGSRDEKWPEEAGLAHALEHMFFQGCKCSLNTQYKIATYIEDVGGIMNAYTSEEHTFYYQKITASEIERSIKVLGKSLNYPLFPKRVIKPQMDVVLQELYSRKDDPEVFLADEWTKTMFGSHPLAQDPIGLKESIQKFSQKDFLRFARQYYHPKNFTYIAVGNANSDDIQHFIDRDFTVVSKKTSTKHIALATPEMPTEPLILHKEIEKAHVVSGAFIGKASAASTVALNLFAVMISGGMSFPFFQEIREKRGDCYHAGTSILDWSDISAFVVELSAYPEKYKSALELALEIIQKEKKNEILINKAKRLIHGRLDLIDNTMSVLQSAANQIATFGKPRSFEETRKKYDDITISQITEAVDKYLKPENFFTGVLLPK